MYVFMFGIFFLYYDKLWNCRNLPKFHFVSQRNNGILRVRSQLTPSLVVQFYTNSNNPKPLNDPWAFCLQPVLTSYSLFWKFSKEIGAPEAIKNHELKYISVNEYQIKGNKDRKCTHGNVLFEKWNQVFQKLSTLHSR